MLPICQLKYLYLVLHSTYVFLPTINAPPQMGGHNRGRKLSQKSTLHPLFRCPYVSNRYYRGYRSQQTPAPTKSKL